MSKDSPIDVAGKQAAYIADEWTDDPAIMQTQALCYVGLQLGRVADALEALSAETAGTGTDAENE
jgi:hypothetical protein